MLVLGCKKGDEIVFGDPENPIGKVSVEKIKGGRVRIGFVFPEGTTINRQKVVNKILDERSTEGEGHDDNEA